MELDNPQLNLRWQYAAYFALAVVAFIFTLILLPTSGAYFQRFFGEMNVILVIVTASLLGAVALWYLQSRYAFTILKGRATLRGMALAAVLATVLAVPIIVADFIIRYPQGMNVPLPQALLFYPAVGFVAEIVFHILPLVVLLLILTPLAGRFGAQRVVWLAILLVAVAEPTFQVLFEVKTFTWGLVYTWVHVFVFAFLQLALFKRFDFVTMYAMRLFYYAYWHILWGTIRLEVLF
jgi:hypothetical protein